MAYTARIIEKTLDIMDTMATTSVIAITLYLLNETNHSKTLNYPDRYTSPSPLWGINPPKGSGFLP